MIIDFGSLLKKLKFYHKIPSNLFDKTVVIFKYNYNNKIKKKKNKRKLL